MPKSVIGQAQWACPSRKVGKPKYVGSAWACLSSSHVVLRGQDLGEPPTQVGPTFHTPTSGRSSTRSCPCKRLGHVQWALPIQSPIGARVGNVRAPFSVPCIHVGISIWVSSGPLSSLIEGRRPKRPQISPAKVPCGTLGTGGALKVTGCILLGRPAPFDDFLNAPLLALDRKVVPVGLVA